MKQRDLDRAFARTPDFIRDSIIEGFEKGEKAMRFRHKIISLSSAAAALVLIVAVAAFAMGGFSAPRQDVVIGQQHSAAPKPTDDPLDAIVYYSEAGKYFHSAPDCSGMQGAQPHSLRDAYAAGKGACPACFVPQTTSLPVTATLAPQTQIYVYAMENSIYYHAAADCSGMENPQRMLMEDAIAKNMSPCPVCLEAQGEIDSAVVYVAAEDPALSFYHGRAACPDLSGGFKALPLSDALSRGLSLCPQCAYSATAFYTDPAGDFYHSDPDCAGALPENEISPALALEDGLMPCPDCVDPADRAVCFTPDGSFYHTALNCSGMRGAGVYSLAYAVQTKNAHCPNCVEASVRLMNPPLDTMATVAFIHGSEYFHIDPECIPNSLCLLCSFDNAVAMGAENPCPDCLDGEAVIVHATPSPMPSAAADAIADAYGLMSPLSAQPTPQPTPAPRDFGLSVKDGGPTAAYITGDNADGLSPDSMSIGIIGGADGPTSIFITSPDGEAVMPTPMPTPSPMPTELASPEPTPMPVEEALPRVYYTAGGSFYHTDEHCSGMQDAAERSLDQAIAAGKFHCPYCVEDTLYLLPLPEDDNDSVYINSRSSVYHLNPECGNSIMPSRITLAEARFLNKSACSECAVSVEVDESLFEKLFGMKIEEILPNSALVGVESHPSLAGSSIAPQMNWEISDGKDKLSIYVSGQTKYQDGVVILSFSSDSLAHSFMERLPEALRTLLLDDAPALIDGLNRLTGAEETSYTVQDICFYFDDEMISRCELNVSINERSYASLIWNLREDEAQISQILWDDYDRG